MAGSIKADGTPWCLRNNQYNQWKALWMGATMCYSCIILPEDPFSFFGNSVWKPGCPLETCTPRGLERDCGNTDADGARATRPRDGDGDGAVHLWMVWWIRHKNSGINSPYGGIIWNYDPYAIMVSEYSCYQYKPRTSRHSQFMITTVVFVMY